jgi:hypothetical protein
VTGYLWAALGLLGGLGMTALGDMVSEEVRDRLDHLPHAILRLVALRLDPAQRVTVYEDEWLPELAYILTCDEARPITRLYHGARYALGILVAVRQITRHVSRPVSDQSQSPASAASPAQSGTPQIVDEGWWGALDLSIPTHRRVAVALKPDIIVVNADKTTVHVVEAKRCENDPELGTCLPSFGDDQSRWTRSVLHGELVRRRGNPADRLPA